MKHRITATAFVALAILTTPAISQDDKKTIEATDKEALGKDAASVKVDAGANSEVLPEATKPKEAAPAAALELPDSVKNLSAEERVNLQKLLNDASAYIGGIRIQEAFEKIIEAEAITPDLFQLHNLKGAAYTKIRDFEKARASFEEALKLNPVAFMSRFNITELDFVEHKFADAEKNFKKILSDSPDMNSGTKRLIEFKILISQLAQDKHKEAKATQATFGHFDEETQILTDYLEDTPAYFFGKAAFAFDAEDEDEARSWIRSAEGIFAPQQVSVYVDSFIEMGWIDNLQ